MVRPVGRPLARRAVTLEDLREEFLAHCEARNLSPRTLEWYADKTRRFADWCLDREIDEPSDLQWADLQAFVLDRRRRGFAANTVHGYAQVVKTLCRLGHRLGYMPDDITVGLLSKLDRMQTIDLGANEDASQAFLLDKLTQVR